MTVSIRVLLAALFAVALATAGALFIGYRTGMIAGQSAFDVASIGDVRDLFATRDAGGARLADLALRKLESNYYK
jgi:hypothetical protein